MQKPRLHRAYQTSLHFNKSHRWFCVYTSLRSRDRENSKDKDLNDKQKAMFLQRYCNQYILGKRRRTY